MFEGYPKEIMTKDGTPILLRPLTPRMSSASRISLRESPRMSDGS